MIDRESISYISLKNHAHKITDIISKHIKKDKHNIVITDAMAGVGGNSISFAQTFKFLNAIEIDSDRSNYLKNNLQLYELNNVEIFNINMLDIIYKLKHDVIFIDPPWGGKSYKKYTDLRLKISNIPIEDICNNLLTKKISHHPPNTIVFKLPKNYDLRYFFKNVMSNNIIFYNMKKMYILVVINENLIN